MTNSDVKRISDRILDYWYSESRPTRWASCLSDCVAAITRRRQQSSRNVSRSLLDIPVVVVGNITVGGTGKTPLITHLVEEFTNRGFKVGIVSRGHGGRGPFPCILSTETTASMCGDEPLLLARRCRVPVVADPDRLRACKTLINAHDPDVIFSDDGLQHYAMPRQVEVVVFDGDRGVGNGLMLPLGPLRESVDRLHDVDAIVVNGTPSSSLAEVLQEHGSAFTFCMSVKAGQWRDLRGQLRTGSPGQLRPIVAVAGIGNPERFFATLRSTGLSFETRVFPDHHHYGLADVGDLKDFDVVITEKDAVKFLPDWVPHVWVLPVRAETKPSLATFIADRLFGDAPRTLEFVE